MKRSYILFSAFLTLLASCMKEQNPSTESNVSAPYKIRTVVENIVTKTDYANEKDFSWCVGDVVSVQITKDASYDKWRFTADEATATSTLTSSKNGDGKNHADLGYAIGNYAFYPNALSPTNAETPTLTLPQTVNQNMTKPLSNVPLIGINQGDDSFKFKTGTGVLKLTFKNAFASIYRLELVSQKASSTYKLSGSSSFDPSTCKIAGGSSNVLYVVPSTVANGQDLVLYAPIPEGTIPANDLKVALYSYGGYGYFLDDVYNPGPIEIKRGVITETPAITLNPLNLLPGRYKVGNNEVYITLAKIDGDPDYNVKITRFEKAANLLDVTDALDVSGECKGTFDQSTGTITFPYMQAFALTGDKWTDNSDVAYSFRGYNYPTQELVLTFGQYGLTGNIYFSKFVTSYTSVSGYLNYCSVVSGNQTKQ